MVSPIYHMLKRNNLTFFKATIFLSLIIRTQTLNISFNNIEYAANDFGDIYHNLPLAVVFPKSANDISSVIKPNYQLGDSTGITIAARGNGHSTQGQAQADKGIVIDTRTLKENMYLHVNEVPYVDVSGGALWIDILRETLRYGLSPKSWTDYLYLTVGGTLSNGGIGGQAFRHGPQIDNVLQLQVVTGKGEILNCSHNMNSDLFYGVLGGLGQFGIITRARISLEPAPSRVKWITGLYNDFTSFSNDQEHLISSQDTFDYIEGSVLVKSSDPNKTVLFGLEVALYYNQNDNGTIEQVLTNLTSPLNYMPSTLETMDVSYVEFLDRVHTTELELSQIGLWDLPHPWLNLLVPKSSIQAFVDEVFGNIINETINGPILIYPVNKSKWQKTTSMVTPDEKIFYLVAILSTALPSPTGKDLERLLTLNERILLYCAAANLGVKEYLPHYTTQSQWRNHFGQNKWDTFVARKSSYDPLGLLAPGQKIFQKE